MQIAVSSWSFHKPLYEGKLRLWEVPGEVRKLGFQCVELQDMFLWSYGNPALWRLRRMFGPASYAPAGRVYDSDLIKRIGSAVQNEGMRLTAWNCDPELGRSGYVDNVQAYIRQALSTASLLGAPILRITMDHAAAGTNIGPIVDTLSRLAIDAKLTGVRMALENHGHQADADQLLGILRGVESPWLGICLDFGNFQPERGEEDFERLAPYAIHAHAKSYDFDVSGEEVSIPYAHRIDVLKATGYDGIIAIEYEGSGDPAEGVNCTRRLIERYWPITDASSARSQ